MAEHLAQQTAIQVPDVLGPHTFDLIAIHQLAEDRFYAIPNKTEEGASLWPRVTGSPT